MYHENVCLILNELSQHANLAGTFDEFLRKWHGAIQLRNAFIDNVKTAKIHLTSLLHDQML